MRYVQINSVPNGSTGAVMMQIERERLALGDECWRMWGRGRAAEGDHELNFGSRVEFYLDVLRTRLGDRAGFHSKAATRRLLAKLDEVDPDVVHLHNLHGYYVNIEMLFSWLASHHCQVRWTLHDCWAFTGHCAHFTYVGCDQWRTDCAHSESCPQLGIYPKTICKRNCARNFRDKRRIFASIPPERMTLITPSRWLESLVKQSFLRGYPVEVRRNTVDMTVFRPTQSDFRGRYGIGDRFMVLGVANPWTERKGLGDFIRLSKELNSERYTIVIVGLSAKQIKALPSCVIGFQRTESREELAKIYSAADAFFNPTFEDNYPTVNLEAEACGTPVVTYDTGGCSEAISRNDSVCVHGYEEAVRALKGMERKINRAGV